MEGDTLLHVVAASGDAQDFLCCARMIVRYKQKKNSGNCMAVLQGRNHRGNTPLHCAAGAGNASMISCLVRLAGTTGEAAARAFVQTQNEDGETALHQAIRATKNMLECIDKLVAMDPGLASIPHASGASPLYLAISLGKLEIAKHLLDRSEGNLSYFGPDGRNVLQAAVSRGRAWDGRRLQLLYRLALSAYSIPYDGP
ncbi:hypothetical protein BS78_05G242900 [Paspalum vaginatum]|nr:hypothetical protein BS78_05G242900 [Paspalum vaginatum]